MLGILIAALVAAQPMSPAAPRDPAEQPNDRATAEVALKLARILSPDEAQVAAAVRMIDTSMGPAFRADPDFQALEAEYPGLLDAILAELRPAIERFTRSELPAYHQKVADLLSSRFTRAEIEDITQFYLTPTGQKLVTGMAANADAGAMMSEIIADPDKPTSYSAIAKDHGTAAEATLKQVDKSDEGALLELAAKPYFAKLAALGPAMRKLDQDFSNEPAPAFEAEVGAIIEAVIARFMVQSENNSGGK